MDTIKLKEFSEKVVPELISAVVNGVVRGGNVQAMVNGVVRGGNVQAMVPAEDFEQDGSIKDVARSGSVVILLWNAEAFETSPTTRVDVGSPGNGQLPGI